MKVAFECLISLVCLAIATSCSNRTELGAYDLNALTTEMATDGWRYLETHGEEGKAAGEFRAQAATARTIAANWMTNGKREEKVYTQSNDLFLIVSIVKGNGDVFAIVYTKPK